MSLSNFISCRSARRNKKMAKKRERIPSLTGPISHVAKTILQCGKAKAESREVNKNLASCLLYDCAKHRDIIFDRFCHTCVVERRRVLRKMVANELRSIFYDLFGLKSVGPWEIIKEDIITAIDYEIEMLAHKRYEDYRKRLYCERQKEIIDRCCAIKQETADHDDRKEINVTKKRKEGEKKSAPTPAPTSASGKRDRVTKALTDKTPKQMLKIAKDYGVDTDKLKKVREAVEGGTQTGLIRMRVGNLMRGVDHSKAK